MMTIPNISGARLESLCEFLSAAGLTYEGGAEYTVLLLDDETDAVVGTGSLCGSVLKYIAVSEAMQGEGGAGKHSFRTCAPCIHMRTAKTLPFHKAAERIPVPQPWLFPPCSDRRRDLYGKQPKRVEELP